MDKIEAKLIIDFCNNFIATNKKVYDDTKLGLKYKELMKKKVDDINKLNLVLFNYNNDEKNYKNRLINHHLHDKMIQIKESLYTLNEDLDYIKKKISSLTIDQKIYDTVHVLENDIQRYTMILNR